MSFIDYQAGKKILVMTKGHPFNREDFFSVFDAIEGVQATAVEQPASQVFFKPSLAKDYDAFVLYDMPGMDFTAPDAPIYIDPPESFKTDFLDLLEAGHGFVFLHHTIAAWPGWPEYAEILGGKFIYKPDTIRGESFPDSGYRHEITHTVVSVSDHPVLDGVPKTFSITDELYLSHVFEESVEPLLVSDYDYLDDNFYSSQHAVKGNMFSREGWQHPPGHNMVGWVKSYGNSPIVYLQCGDSKAAYDNPAFQTLLRNAINWVSSDKALAWAKKQNNK
jgi:type 1 glutamine amidotransferase